MPTWYIAHRKKKLSGWYTRTCQDFTAPCWFYILDIINEKFMIKFRVSPRFIWMVSKVSPLLCFLVSLRWMDAGIHCAFLGRNTISGRPALCLLLRSNQAHNYASGAAIKMEFKPSFVNRVKTLPNIICLRVRTGGIIVTTCKLWSGVADSRVCCLFIPNLVVARKIMRKQGLFSLLLILLHWQRSSKAKL